MTFNQMLLVVNLIAVKFKGKSINKILTKYDNAFDKTIICGNILIDRERIFVRCNSRSSRNFTIVLRNGEIYYWLSIYGYWEKLNVPENILEDIV